MTKADFSPNNTKEEACFSPKIFTTHPKKIQRRKNKQTQPTEDSTAKSILFFIEQELGLNGLFEGEHNHLSFDCPKPLTKAFKRATKANGTSICQELRKYALTYVANYELQKKAFGSTLSRVLNPKLTIENLNCNQYVQSRPRRLMRNVEPEFLRAEGKLTCQIGDCRNVSVGLGIYLRTGKKYRLCRFHSSEYADNADWRLLS